MSSNIKSAITEIDLTASFSRSRFLSTERNINVPPRNNKENILLKLINRVGTILQNAAKKISKGHHDRQKNDCKKLNVICDLKNQCIHKHKVRQADDYYDRVP